MAHARAPANVERTLAAAPTDSEIAMAATDFARLRQAASPT